MIRMPKMPQPGKKPVAPVPEPVTETEAEAAERKAAARKYLDAERAAHRTALTKPLREDREKR